MLCDPVCAISHGSGPLYRDDNHLALLAARDRLAPVLRHALRQGAGFGVAQLPQ
jgi:hypothetical protein